MGREVWKIKKNHVRVICFEGGSLPIDMMPTAI